MFAPLVYGCFTLQLLDPFAQPPVSHRCVCVCVCTVQSMLMHVVVYFSVYLFGLVLCCC